MSSEPRAWIRALRESHDDVVRRARRLGPEQLEEVSYCPDWTIAQLLGHIGSSAEYFLQMMEHSVDGRPALGPESYPKISERWDSLGPEDRVAEMVVWDRRLVSFLEALADDDLANLHTSLGGMDFDAVGVIGLRLAEHALHRWDLLVSEEESGEILESSVELLIDRVPLLAGRVGKAEKAPAHRSIGIRTRDPERRYLLTVRDVVALRDASDELRDGMMEIPAEALIRLVFGRLDPQHTPEGIVTEGAADLDELRSVFPGL